VWGRDPDAAEKEIERRLVRGEGVELIGTGPMSGPVWSQVVLGTGVMDRSDKEDRAFRFQSFSPVGLLELLRDPRMDRYEIQAEVRHEADLGIGLAGLFLSRRAFSSAAGDVQVFIPVTYNGIHSLADQNRHWNEDNPDQPPKPVPKANPVYVNARVYGSRNGMSFQHNLDITAKELFQPSVQWRSLAVKATPEIVRVSWEGQEQPELSFPPGRVGDVIRNALSGFNIPNPFPGGVTPTFDPHGSLGLFAYQGAASFRNVRIAPLGPAD
jgi:hypothetical protein